MASTASSAFRGSGSARRSSVSNRRLLMTTRKLATHLLGQLPSVFDLGGCWWPGVAQEGGRVGYVLPLSGELPADELMGELADVRGVEAPQPFDDVMDNRD